MHLENRKITLGITGGIAAYKTAGLIRLLKQNGAEVQVIMTNHAQEFITPLTLQTLSRRTVYSEQFNQNLNYDLEHINVARWSDAILIAPATANIMAKLAHGIADDLLTTTCLATTAPIALAPAMNKEMWANTINQENIVKLQKHGHHIFGPASGWQACGETGLGRMLEPAEIIAHLNTLFVPQLFTGKKIVITAGPTIEPIDPVRYISNHSSGKMGYAIAEAAANYGADVTLISGKTDLAPPHNVNFLSVNTAKEMHQAVLAEINECAIFISTAAVADYCSTNIAPQKIKKSDDNLILELTKNPDILSAVATIKCPPLTVGFAAETDNLENNAINKLKNKKIDIIAANQVSDDQGFYQDNNSLKVFTKHGKSYDLELQNKTNLAYELLKIINDYHNN